MKKVLIIGGGAVSEMFHIPAAIELLGRENVIVAELSTSQRHKLGKTFQGIDILENYERGEGDADFVIIASPPHTHLEIMEYCLKRQLPFLCEKPLAFSAASVQQLSSDLIATKLTAGICHTYRFFPNRIEVRGMIQEGFFGISPEVEILEGDPSSWSPVSGYSFRRDITPGGVLLDGGIHSLDFLIWCFGTPTVSEYYDDSLGGIESNARLSMTFSNNGNAFFRISRTCALPNTIRITGNDHTVVVGIFEFFEYELDGKAVSVEGKYPTEASGWADLPKVQLSEFITSIEEKRAPRCTLGEAAQGIGIIENCYQLKAKRPLPDTLPLPGLTF